MKTPKRPTDPGLDGGYWGTDSAKRTPKLKIRDLEEHATTPESKNTPKKKGSLAPKSNQSANIATTPVASRAVQSAANTPTQSRRTAQSAANTPTQSRRTAQSAANTPTQSRRTAQSAANTPIQSRRTAQSDANTPTQSRRTARRAKSVSETMDVSSPAVNFTEVVTATGSGRRVKITCGDSRKAFAPSSGLGEYLPLQSSLHKLSCQNWW